jgi:hypothetical protein
MFVCKLLNIVLVCFFFMISSTRRPGYHISLIRCTKSSGLQMSPVLPQRLGLVEVRRLDNSPPEFSKGRKETKSSSLMVSCNVCDGG